MENRRGVARAAGQISAATAASRVLGFVRDMVLAKIFGATGVTDAFFIAYRIPNLFRELFAEGSMSAAFVPVFTETLAIEGRDAARQLAASVFAFLLLVLSLLCVSGILFAPYLVSVIAPGFVKTPEKFDLTVQLTQIMFPFLFFISLAALAKGILNSDRSFFIPALAPVFLNIAIIIAALFIAPHFRSPIAVVAGAVSAGGALQVLIQMPDLRNRGFLVKPVLNMFHKGLKKILRLLLPAIVGMGVAQINIFVSTIFVSFLPGGAATYLYYAMRFVHLPIGMFGVAMATAVLPSLSEYAAKGQGSELRDIFSFSLRILFFITLPAMAGLISLSAPIVEVLLQRGEFSPADTAETVYALIFYSSGLWAFVGARVVASTFYSLQDTKTPVKIASLSVIANIILSLLLMGPMRHAGLAFANALASGINFMVLFLLLRRKLGRVDGRSIFLSFLRSFSASAVMGIIGFFLIHAFMWDTGATFLHKALPLASVMALCAGIYLLLMYLFGSGELSYLMKMRKSKT